MLISVEPATRCLCVVYPKTSIPSFWHMLLVGMQVYSKILRNDTFLFTETVWNPLKS